MNEFFSNKNLPKPPALTATQQGVSSALKSKETDEYPLGDWYLGAVYAFRNKYNPDRISQAAHSLRELLEKLPRVVHSSDMYVSTFDFQGMRQRIYNRWINDRKRYDRIWMDKKIDVQLDKTLRKLDQYLEANQKPTRREQIQSAIKQIDPMANMLSLEIQVEKLDQFYALWREIESFAHHRSNPDEQRFIECFSAVERTILDLLAPVTAQNQQEIKAILKKSEPTETDIKSMLELIKRRGANYAFFFQEAVNATWVPILEKEDFFTRPPNVEHAGEGQVTVPSWPPILFLQRVVSSLPEKVIDILANIETDNPHILHVICEIACQIENSELSLKLYPSIISYIKSPYHWHNYEDISNLLIRWSGESNDSLDAALEILKYVVPLRVNNIYERVSYISKRNYQLILEKGVRPLANNAPYQTAAILIKATAGMLRSSIHQEELDKKEDEDRSEIWCRRLNQPHTGHQDIKATLVHTLTFACEKVYEKSPESIESLDETLRNHRWKVFKRLRQHLYALNPNEQTLPWLREFILEHGDYAKWEYHFEFQQMVRKACEYFGADLLNKEERTAIFDAILSGPSKDNFREWMGDQFTEENFLQWQRSFHRAQLHPFASLLTGTYQSYFEELQSEFEAETLSDEDYSPVGKFQAGTVSYRSPRSVEDLSRLSDQELLEYINEWEDEHRDRNDRLVEINISALADVFKTLFKDTIIHDEERLAFWMHKDNSERIERPIYVKTIIQAIQEHVKEQHFERLDLWFGFSEWVLSHPDVNYEEGVETREKSRDHPDWRSSRQAVQELVAACVEEEINVPFSARKSLAERLGLLCTQFDRGLDGDEPIFLNNDDQILEALNNTRSSALQALAKFGFWVRGHDTEDTAPEITSILETRLNADAEWPLTMPERAMLGMNFGNLLILNKTWAIEHRTDFFPQDDLPVWIQAFGSFLRFNQPFKPTFEILEQEFAFALDHLADLKAKEHQHMEPIDRLGQDLFTYYLWDFYPLKGKGSLLEKFYEKTTKERQQWAGIFDHIGRSLSNSGTHLDDGLEERIVAFFDWRLEAGEPKELAEFTFWLQAKCLAPDWRLDAYSKTLDIPHLNNMDTFMELDSLNDMLENHTSKVVECFAKITGAIDQGNRFYIQTEKAKPILVAGLRSEDESVRKNAESARENLLRDGRFDILDIDE